MNSVLIEVYVPIAESKYDLFIPTQLSIYNAQILISKIITEISEGLFIMNSETILCSKEDGMIFDINMSIYESGIRNGSKLMLI